MKTVLVLGAGLVTRPLVQYLLDRPDTRVTVASRTLSKAKNLVGDRPNGRAIAFDITRDGASLGGLVAEADIAISLLPYIYHLQVAESTCATGQRGSGSRDVTQACGVRRSIAEVELISRASGGGHQVAMEGR